MISEKQFLGKKRVFVDCEKDIIFSHTESIDGKIYVFFSDAMGSHDGCKIREDLTWEDLEPKVLIGFERQSSIDKSKIGETDGRQKTFLFASHTNLNTNYSRYD